MAARKSTKKTQANAETADSVESKVVALAEQLGWFLGTVRGKADGLLANDTVRQEVARIRDGAAELMEHVNRAGASAQQAAASATETARNAAATVGTSARNVVATAATSAKQVVANASATAKQVVTGTGTTAKQAVLVAGTASRRAAKTTTGPQPVVAVPKPSRGAVDAPGKRHRKPPPQEKIDKRMGEPVGKQMGQKNFQVGKSRGRG